MNCPVCKHGRMRADTITVTLERGGVSVVFTGAPAQVCENCGERYVDEATTSRLLAQAADALKAESQVEVRPDVIMTREFAANGKTFDCVEMKRRARRNGSTRKPRG